MQTYLCVVRRGHYKSGKIKYILLYTMCVVYIDIIMYWAVYGILTCVNG